MPSALSLGHEATAYLTSVYITGGKYVNGALNDEVYKYDTLTGT